MVTDYFSTFYLHPIYSHMMLIKSSLMIFPWKKSLGIIPIAISHHHPSRTTFHGPATLLQRGPRSVAFCGQLYPFHGDAGAGTDARREGDMAQGCPNCPWKMWGRGGLDELFKLWVFMDDIYGCLSSFMDIYGYWWPWNHGEHDGNDTPWCTIGLFCRLTNPHSTLWFKAKAKVDAKDTIDLQ